MSTPVSDTKIFETSQGLLDRTRQEIGKRFVGQDQVLDLTLATMLAGGHGLIVGVPGLGKSRLVETLGVVAGLTSHRVQFTPDLMPSDILGSEILDTQEDGSRRFRFIQGPVFCQLLMADEINRASPRTQAALLQAMQERQVSVAGQTRDLPTPFSVFATQNPIEQEGTYPLPEAQLDRFLTQISITYPDRATEAEILRTTTGTVDQEIAPVLSADHIKEMQHLVRALPIGDGLVADILDFVRRFRPDSAESNDRIKSALDWGAGPRAAQALVLVSKALALLEGDYAPTRAHVERAIVPVMSHRIGLRFSAKMEGLLPSDLIANEWSKFMSERT